jgi:hypothetical protein
MTAPPIAPQVPGTGPVLDELFGPDGAPPGAFSDGAGISETNEIAAPNPPDDDDTIEQLDRLSDLMASLYGSSFPLIEALARVRAEEPEWDARQQLPPLERLIKETEPDDWQNWVRSRWSTHRQAVEMHLYLVARNRLFRAGQQWVSSKGREPWREPARPTESARVVHNLIGPALDQRVQVIADQRPGFEILPLTETPDERRKAEGRQVALEYQFDEQHMDRMTREAAYWAGTDGVAFWHVYWDRDAGPWDPRMGNKEGEKKPLGDLRTQTLRCEQVRASADATATRDPYYGIIREVLSETEAAYLYGVSGVQDRATYSGDLAGQGDTDTSGANADGAMPSWVLSQTIVGEGHRLNNVRTVERFIMYVDRHPDVLPDGLQIVIVGNAVVWGPDELQFGVIPIVAVRDGSTDPSYYPRPIMEQWVPPQMRVNAALSLWVNAVRVNAGGRFLARPDSISRETYVGAGSSILEVEGAGPLGDNVLPVQGFLVGQDVKDLISFDVKAIEDMSGYNDVSRGQVSNETATAVASANEHIERVFSPAVEAMGRAFEDWAEINLAGMAWGYDIPRDLGAVGKSRPDLARSLSADQFEGPATVKVDASKLIPMPKVYRMQVLDDWLNRGLITPQQYMRNVKFANFKQLSSPDEDQEARAKRVADAIREGKPLPPAPPLPSQMPLPGAPPQIGPDGQPIPPPDPATMAAQPLALRWQTNEAIEQDVLERMILLQDDLAPEIVKAAGERWQQLAAQQAAKMPPPMAPPGGAPGGGAPGGAPPGGGGPPPIPEQAPPGGAPAAAELPPSATAPVPGIGG